MLKDTGLVLKRAMFTPVYAISMLKDAGLVLKRAMFPQFRC